MKKLILIIMLIGIASVTKAQEVNVNKTFDNITEVEINLVFSDVEIEAVKGDQVSVEGYVHYSNEHDDYTIKTYQKGTKLYLEVEHPKRSKGNASGQFHLKMPAMTDVQINNVSGNIAVSGVGQRFVKINSVSGDIRVEKIGSTLNCNSVSGDVNAFEIKGNLSISTVSGDQSITNVDGNFKGSSISGDFKIENLKGNKEISTISGSVR